MTTCCDVCQGRCQVCVYCNTVVPPNQAEYMPARAGDEPELVCLECQAERDSEYGSSPALLAL